jgi:two-component system, sensor histidine kinase and response regulator
MVNSKKAKILIVDDEEHIVKALRYVLENEGFDVETAFDGEETLNMVENSKPDIILLDVMMPKKNGYDVCRILKEDKRTQLIPIVMLTALKQKEERIKGIEAGADDFISKPIDQRELLTRIKSLLRIKSLYDELEENCNKLQSLKIYNESLTDMVVRDMKSILSGAIGNLNLLSTKTEQLNDNQKEYVESTQASNNDLLNIILNLLDIRLLEENKFKINREKIDLEEIVKNSIISQEPLAKLVNKQIVQEMNLPEKTILYADKGLVERVLANLLNNAIKHSEGNSDIIVRAGQGSDNCLEVCVENNGSYIPKEYHGKVFEKFGQLEVSAVNKRLGKGLGLTFCKLAITAQKGRIWLESDMSGHNKFCFALPIG